MPSVRRTRVGRIPASGLQERIDHKRGAVAAVSLIAGHHFRLSQRRRGMLVETAPAWLATMRELDGTLELPGGPDNPVILSWSDTIARAFPEMASYADTYKHDSIAWCGQALAYAMAVNGIRPPYDPGDELKSYLWVDSWAHWGTLVPAGQERRGDVLVFSSPHHVTLYEGQVGEQYLGHGGNQNDSVRISQYFKRGINTIRRPPFPTVPGEPTKVVPVGSSSNRFHSLIGGFFSSTPKDRSSWPVAIRTNNPGAINSVSWVRDYPGYVSEVETDGNWIAIFETPEHGIAAWYQLMKDYRSTGASTVREIIERHCEDQDYSDYIADAVARTGLSADHEIALEGDDSTLLKFAKAMFHQEAGGETPLSGNQILYGFKFAREYARSGHPPATNAREDSSIKPQPKFGNPLLLLLLLMILPKEKQLADDPAKPWQGIDIEMLWPLLLESAMTGRQIDTTHLLSVMLTGKPGASAASAPTAAAQQDINALLLPL